MIVVNLQKKIATNVFIFINMSKLRLNLLALIAVLGFSFQSCNDDEGYSLGDIAFDWATVVSDNPSAYYLIGDTWGTMWPAATSIPLYKPTNGQRVMVLFNPLYDNFQGFDVGIKVEDVEEILTKKVEMLTESNDKEFGNDPIYILEGNMGVSGKHLNIIFSHKIPLKEKHRISLVTSATEAEADGYMPLELRFNTYQDESDIWVDGKVSFNLEEYVDNPAIKGIRLTMHSPENGMRKITFDF